MKIEYYSSPVVNFKYCICTEDNLIWYTNIELPIDISRNQYMFRSDIIIHLKQEQTIEIVKNSQQNLWGRLSIERLREIEHIYPGIYDLCKLFNGAYIEIKQIDTTPQFEIL